MHGYNNIIIKFSLSLSLSIRRAALEKWKQKFGSVATYDKLIQVFENAKYKDLADFVRKIACSGKLFCYSKLILY